MNRIESTVMSRELEPRCPRDNHVMRYEPAGIQWKDPSGKTATLPSYHCPYMGCSVRYDPANGYFTVIGEPDLPYFVEEPATNLRRCPWHGAWLFRQVEGLTGRFVLKCGAKDCAYAHSDVGGIWLRE